MKSKLLLLIFVMIFASNSYSRDVEHGNFEKRKAKIISELDLAKAQIEKTISCIKVASNHETLQSCIKNHRNIMKSNKERRQNFRKEHQEKRKAKLQERLQKIHAKEQQ